MFTRVLRGLLKSAMYKSHCCHVRAATNGGISQNGSAEMTTARPIVICGPSGSGKSTVLQRIFEKYPDAFAFSVSHTSRQPRPGEQHGKDYYFVPRDELLKMIENGEFLEHAQFSGNIYGTSKKAVLDIQKTGRICILDVEIQGVRNIKKTSLNARYLLLKPPSRDILEKRLRGRGTESEEAITKRLNQADADMKEIEADPELFDYVIVNDDLDEACREFERIFADDLTVPRST